MQPTRRDLIRAGLATAAAGALAGCAEVDRRLSPGREAATLPTHVDPTEVRLANRLGFGPAGDDLEQIRALGHEGYVTKALAASNDEDFALKFQLRRLDAPAYDAYDLRDMPENQVLTQLQTGTLLRCIYGSNQLLERMTDFWGNHFNVYGRKGLSAYRLAKDGREVVRANALGNFMDLLLASAQSPAMLMYLDNHFNEKGIPNENYAREIMELHTMGVDGGYSQKDVMEVARCLTGWGLENRSPMEAKAWTRRGAYRFNAEAHDNGEKTVLGHRIPAGGGKLDGEQVVAILAKHPSTARNVCRKLCHTFVGDGEAKIRGEAEKTFLASNGDVKATLKVILLSKDLLEGPPIMKRPLDYIVGSLRATGAQTDGAASLQEHLAAMGQPLYQWPMPDGYSERAESWSGTLLARWNFALALSEDRIAGTRMSRDASVQKTMSLLSGHVTDEPEMALIAPAYQWR